MKKISLLTVLASTALASVANSPFVAKVHDFLPAPGQFINTLPEVTAGMSKQDVIQAVEEQLVGDERPGMISLGAFGGYVVFSFDHPVVNVAGQYDFKIYGNAFVADQASDGGNCEPGIVMVSADDNADGIPNDKWYELRGSEWDNPEAIRDFKIVYSRPSQLSKAENISWTSSSAAHPSGVVETNKYHDRSYWPLWLSAENQLEFTGTRLPDNAYDKSGTGVYWVLRFFKSGYVDNLPDFIQDPEQGYIPNPDAPGFNIDNAVNPDGTPANLRKIDFIKVYSAMNQTCGSIGETSTEICGARDLHPDAIADSGIASVAASSFAITPLSGNRLKVSAPVASQLNVWSASGNLLVQIPVAEGSTVITLPSLPSGLAILSLGSAHTKMLIP